MRTPMLCRRRRDEPAEGEIKKSKWERLVAVDELTWSPSDR